MDAFNLSLTSWARQTVLLLLEVLAGNEVSAGAQDRVYKTRRPVSHHMLLVARLSQRQASINQNTGEQDSESVCAASYAWCAEADPFQTKLRF